MTKCGNGVLKAIYNYKKFFFVTTKGRINVTSESILSGLWSSQVLHATRWVFHNYVWAMPKHIEFSFVL